jgi:hypothetical protein
MYKSPEDQKIIITTMIAIAVLIAFVCLLKYCCGALRGRLKE